MGVKRMRGQGILHGEVKEATTYRLTPTAKEAIRQSAEGAGLSQAEYIEQWARSLHDASEGLETIKAAGFTSVSQFLEELGRGNVSLLHPRNPDKLE